MDKQTIILHDGMDFGDSITIGYPCKLTFLRKGIQTIKRNNQTRKKRFLEFEIEPLKPKK